MFYSNEEYADMHFIYGLCNGNAIGAKEEYRRRFPRRHAPSYGTFLRIHLRLREIGSTSRAARQPNSNIRDADAKECILACVRQNPTKVEMIESDILMGTLFEDKTKVIPIMAHPPNNESDLSLEYYLQNITEYNTKNPNSQKGIKLDFKSIDAFEKGIDTIKSHSTIIKKMWFNADILNGPGNSKNVPVDAIRFLNTAKEISDTNTLSIGWTTDLVADASKVKYEESQINQMIALIKDNGIVNRSITYPVRAVYAANSEKELNDLLTKTNGTNNNGTLSIWSADMDHSSINVKKLRDFILKIGVHRVYLDVPIELQRELHLNSSGSLKASFINFTIISMLLVLVSEYLK